MHVNLQQLDRTPSTNAEVRRAIDEGRPEGFAVLAREQSAGYGRRGNAWASPRGGMYLSLLLRPTRPLPEWPTLSLLAAVAVRRAIVQAVPAIGSMLRIKPPNDVIAGFSDDGRPLKLAGILPENHAGAVALGIGLNVQRPAEFQPVDGRNVPVFVSDYAGACGAGAAAVGPVSALQDATSSVSPSGLPFCAFGGAAEADGFLLPPDAHGWALLVLDSFQTCYGMWLETGFDAFRSEYDSHATEALKR